MWGSARHTPIHVAAVLPLIKRTIPCWVIGSLGLPSATPSLPSRSSNLRATRPRLVGSLRPGGQAFIQAGAVDKSMSRPPTRRDFGATFQLSSPLAGAFGVVASERSKLSDLLSKHVRVTYPVCICRSTERSEGCPCQQAQDEED